jgi:hypothetical protein
LLDELLDELLEDEELELLDELLEDEEIELLDELSEDEELELLDELSEDKSLELLDELLGIDELDGKYELDIIISFHKKVLLIPKGINGLMDRENRFRDFCVFVQTVCMKTFFVFDSFCRPFFHWEVFSHTG